MQIEAKDLTPRNLAGGVLMQFQDMYDQKSKLTYKEVSKWLSRCVLAAGPNGHLYVTENDVRLYLARLNESDDGQTIMDDVDYEENEPTERGQLAIV